MSTDRVRRRSAFSGESSVASSPSDSVDEAAQVGAVGDQGEQAVDAEPVEVRQGRLAVHLPPDVHRLERLVVGRRQVGRRDVIGRDTPVEKLRRPPPPSPRTTLAISPTVRITASGSASGPTGTQGDDLLAEARHRARWCRAAAHRLHPGAGRTAPAASAPRRVSGWSPRRSRRSRRRRRPSAGRCPSRGRRRATTASAGSPARPARASRRNSARYLPSTAATACSLVMASAATVAARSSRCTSAAVSGRSGENAPSRPWSEAPATILTKARVLPGASRRRAGPPARSRRAGGRCGRSSRGRGTRSTSASSPAIASTRPSVVVTTAAPPKKPATASHELGEGSRRRARCARARGAPRPRARGARPGCSTICSSARTRAAGSAGRAARSTAGRASARAVRWQGLCVTGPIVGNNDHPVTVDPSIASAVMASDRPPSRSVPAAVSTLSAAVVGGSAGPATVVGVHRFALYLDVAGRVLPVLHLGCRAAPHRAAPRCSRRDRCRWGVVAGDEVLVGGGRVALPALDVVVARTWRPARVRRAWRSALPPAPRWLTLLRCERWQPRPGGSPTASAASLPASGAEVVGRDSHLGTPTRGRGRRAGRARAGLTPSGDDALAGALLVAFALGTRHGARRRRARPPRCRPPRCPPRCSTPPPTGTPRATSSPSSTPPSRNDADAVGARPARPCSPSGTPRAPTSSAGRPARPLVAAHRGTDRTEGRMTHARRAAPRRLPRLGEPDAGLAARVAGTAGRQPRPRSRWPPSSTSTCCAAWASTCPRRPARTTSSSRCAPTTPRRVDAGLAAVADAAGRAARPTTDAGGGDDASRPARSASAAARARRHPGPDLRARPARRRPRPSTRSRRACP